MTAAGKRLRRRDRCYRLGEMIFILEGSSTEADVQKLAAHLARCVKCSGVHDGWESLDGKLGRFETHTGCKVNKSPIRVHLRERMHAQAQQQIPRVPGEPRSRTPRYALAAGAAVAVCLMLIVALQPLAVVPLGAEALLQRAIGEEATQPPLLIQTLRIRTATTMYRSLVHMSSPPVTRTGIAAGSAGAAGADACAVGAENLPASYAAVLRGNGLDPCRPLSAREFAAWAAKHSGQRMRAARAGGRGLLRVRVSPTDGPIREAILTVRGDTFHAVKLSVTVERMGTLVIEEASLRTLTWEEQITVAAVTSAVPRAVAAIDLDLLEQWELDARRALGEIGLDLGRGVRVARSEGNDAVHVTGFVATTRDRDAAIQRLTSLGTVRTTLRVGTGRDVTRTAARVRELRSLTSPDVLRQIDRRYERDGGVSFVGEMQHQMAGVTQRLDVLLDLAARYSAPRTATFSEAARGKLLALVDFHYRRLRSDLDNLFPHVMQLTGVKDLVNTRAVTPPDWRQRSRLAKAHAEELEWQFQDLLTQPHLFEQHNPARAHPVADEFDKLWETVFARAGDGGFRDE